VSDKPENPPAFPRTDDAWWGGEQGMTLRDYFAGQALVGALINNFWDDAERMASRSYQLADAMLKERSK
jgi:hypothetical protein